MIIQKQKKTQISKRLSATVVILPIAIGAVVILFAKAAGWVSFWLLEKRIPRGGFSSFIIGYFMEGLFQIIPFAVIALVVNRSDEKGAHRAEIFLKLICTLMPVSIMTAYWLFIHIDPFARCLLIFINLALVLIGWLIGDVISKGFRTNIHYTK